MIKIVSIMAIEWAPINVSMERRLQVFSAFCFIAMVMLAETFCMAFYISMMYHGGAVIRTCCFIYLIFMIYDRHADEDCSRGQGNEFVRNNFLWRNFTKYFPIKLVKTVDLPPNQNYLFAVFPHGVISTGAFGNFATSTTTFQENFPGIRTKVCTLSYHFHVPIFREICLGWGLCSAKISSIKRALTQSNAKQAACNSDGYTSNACVLMVGGAQEALNSRPGIYRIILKKRRGFIRAAIECGTPIVPVFSFGEVDIFDQPSNPPGSKLRKFQETIKRLTGVAPAFFIGRGFLQYSYGLIPRRRPVTTVVGAPLNVTKNLTPSIEEIQELHEKFTNALQDLFDTHKSKYIKNAESVKLIIE